MRRLVFYFILSLLGSFVVAASIYFLITWLPSYEHFIHRLSVYVHSPHQLARLRSVWVTPAKFEVLRVLWIGGTLAWTIAFGWILHKREHWFRLFQSRTTQYRETFNLFKTIFCSIPLYRRVIFFLFILTFFLIRLYAAYHYSLTYDEVYIWEEFVQRGWAVIGAYYPVHGNHILQTYITYFFSFLGPYTALRLPSICFAFVLDVLVFFWVFHRTRHFVKSLSALCLFNMFYVNGIHSFLGRGYQLALLLSFCIFILYEKQYASKFLYELVLAQVLLLYTLPSGLFFLLPLWAVNFRSPYIIKNILLTGIASFLLYLPVLVFMNYRALFHTAYYEPVEVEQRWKFFNQLWQIPDYWQVPSLVGVLMTLLALAASLRIHGMPKFFGLYIIITAGCGIGTSFPAKAFMPLTFFWIFFITALALRWNFLSTALVFSLSALMLLSDRVEFEQQFKVHFQADAFASRVLERYPKDIKMALRLSPEDVSDIYFLMLKHHYHQKGYKVEIEDGSPLVMLLKKEQREGKVLYEDENMKMVLLR